MTAPDTTLKAAIAGRFEFSPYELQSLLSICRSSYENRATYMLIPISRFGCKRAVGHPRPDLGSNATLILPVETKKPIAATSHRP